MSADWSRVALGAVSLFPLLGELKKLRGFFPVPYKQWYILFSTIFSLFVYYSVQFQFEKFNSFSFFISPWIALFFGLVLLLIYLILYLPKRDVFNQLPQVKRATCVIGTLIIYIFFASSLTYSFNVLENFKDFYFISGNIILEGDKFGGSFTSEIRLNPTGGDGRIITSNIRKNGKFFFIINKEDYKKINDRDIFEFVYDKDGKYFRTKIFKKDLPLPDSKWRKIKLKSFPK